MDQKEERNLFDPDFCESRCPICTRARKGHRLARFLQRIKALLTFGGWPGFCGDPPAHRVVPAQRACPLYP
jgi:hypothetical protein